MSAAVASAFSSPYTGRYIAGLPWGPDTAKLPQAAVTLTQDDACKLKLGDRLERLQAAAEPGVHLQVIQRAEPCQPTLLITGKQWEDVKAAQAAIDTMLHKEPGLIIAIHPGDVEALKSGTALLEKQSGCRIVVRAPKPKAGDSDMAKKVQEVELLGSQAHQARAIQLLAELCPHMAELCGGLAARSAEALQAFSPILRGLNVELDEGRVVARRHYDYSKGRPYASDCVVVGDGPVASFAAGRFFCLCVRAVDRNLGREFRGGTRIGVCTVPVKPPAPDSLLTNPGCSWVLGRSVVRGPDFAPQTMPAASFDDLVEGDELGLLVTSGTVKGQKAKGTIKIYKRSHPDDEWQCHLEWEAAIPDPEGDLFALLELSGRLAEVELLPPNLGQSAYGAPKDRSGGASSGKTLYLGPPKPKDEVLS